MYDFDTSTTPNPRSDCRPIKEMSVFKINDVSRLPKDQYLRHMGYHVRRQDLNGVIGYNPQVCQEINTNAPTNLIGNR